jgi:hypothetical protein
MIDKVTGVDTMAAGMGKNAVIGDAATIKGRYVAECRDADGNLKWQDTIENLITTAGKNDMLDKHLAGSAYTAAFYMGLISTASYTTGPAVTDTMASHGGWAEDQQYSQASRPTCAFSAAAAGSKELSAALSFSINATTTIKGAFINSVATKGGTTGILFSAGLFSGGDKAVGSGDTLSVSYSASLT